jgi:hypothetical protein
MTKRKGFKRHAPVLDEMLNYKRDGTPFRTAVLVASMLDENGQLAFFGFASPLDQIALASFADLRLVRARTQTN